MTSGFALIPGLLDDRDVSQLIGVLGAAEGAGSRGMLAQADVRMLAGSEKVLAAVRPHLPAAPRAVRAIYFDKTPDANWLVPWHQDLTICVEEKRETPGFGPWSEKAGQHHVQPPAEILEQMITLRIHLDDTGPENGALRVLPGSHRHGKLSAAQITALRNSTTEEVCAAAAGDALLMRPLLLHASSRSSIPGHRRILHIEFAGCDLPAGLRWNEFA